MRKIIFVLILGMLLYGCGATKNVGTVTNSTIITHIDILNVVDDKVLVTINPGVINTDTTTFLIPKTIPGTYSIDDYGKYIDGFKAIDYEGNQLSFTHNDVNSWVISDAKKLDKIMYYVNDTYDTEAQVSDAVFSPAGTNILKNHNFVLNLHGFVGYFQNFKEVPYELHITKPKSLFSTTSLKVKSNKTLQLEKDVFTANRYFDVIDNPILYAKANTESFQINDITVTLSVYSPNNVYTAASLKERMEKMMTAQKAFLGDIDGTKEYNILLYLSKMDNADASGFGALEHHTSTVVVLPEAMPRERLEQAMVDVVSHEFFHIVTPLNVHSKEVQYFDFNDPKMSQHLWMYEGTTEYFANLFQIQQGLISEDEFYKRIMDKVANSKSYDDAMSFTTMSKNILKEPYEKNYANVYEKGALINMALDITLRELSNGEKGILWLMKELSKKYDVSTPFEDDKLITEIVKMTYPELQTFFDTHVIGSTPIDYATYFAKVGLGNVTEQQQTGYFLAGEIPFIDVDQENNNAVFVREGIELSTFYTDLGVQGGDVIKSINGTPINLAAIRPIIGESFGWTPETLIKMVVVRNGKEVVIEGKVGSPILNVTKLSSMDSVSEKSLNLRNAWLKN
ncbi:peptidase M61 [uncultured Maribacter sp.]|uniref:M61 family metallopeptidase n=1 Tax=uncultured Maribacter sp. TaxID=431308 RepID=UPI00261E9FC9|nr:peptidase M61 [uncultured Maribacter sp.]